MTKKQKIGLFSIIGVVVLAGISYAFFNYTAISEENNSIILGEVAMQFNTDNTFYMENVMPEDGIDTSKYLGFTIGGINTDTLNDVWYEILLEYGDTPTGKTVRLRDNDLVFRLTEQQGNGSEVIVLDGVSYQTINDKRIWVNTIPKNTTSDIEYTYKLYVWLSEDIEIGNTETADYTLEEWHDIYASVKVKVVGDLVKREMVLTIDSDNAYIENELSYFNTRLQTGVPDGEEDTLIMIITDPESKVTFTYTNEAGTTYTNVDRVSIDYTYTQDILKQQKILLTSKRDVTENVNLYFQIKKGNNIIQEFTKRILAVGNNFCVNNGFTRLSDCILVSEDMSTSVDAAISLIDAKGSPNTSYTAPHYVNGVETQYSQKGLYKVEDDYGYSYIYRGAVTNNNVKFGNYYWKIIRINGDGTIRMIYNGQATGNNRPGATTTIGNFAFNMMDAGHTYVGYMYNDSQTPIEHGPVENSSLTATTNYYWGSSYTKTTDSNGITRFSLSGTLVQATPLEMYAGEKADGTPLDLSETPYNVLSTSSTGTNTAVIKYINLYVNGIGGDAYYISMSLSTNKNDVEKNRKESNAKINLENWFRTSFNSNYNNDKLVTTYLADEVFCAERDVNGNNDGYILSHSTAYASYTRLSKSPPEPVLKCSKKNDAFTVNDRVFGNGMLKYPVGLITADEAALAGAKWATSSDFYLKSNNTYWSMTPSYYSYAYARTYVLVIGSGLGNDRVNYSNSLRPVINLKSNVTIIEGDGTVAHPFVIE